MVDATREGEFHRLVREAQNLAFPTRASELQQEMIVRLKALLEDLATEKQALVSCEDEAGANVVLAMELLVESVQLELKMWLKIKRDDPNRAWRDLVEAQRLVKEATRVAQQASVEIVGAAETLRKLEMLEGAVFPPQTFVSMGVTVRGYDCSVCGSGYEDCEHISGQVYMGEVCRMVVVGPLETSHVAIVENPADKRCRFTEWAVDGVMRDVMTWKPTRKAVEGQASIIVAVAD